MWQRREQKSSFFPLAKTYFRASKNGECLIVACRGSRINCRVSRIAYKLSRVKWRKPNVVFVGKLSPALLFLLAKTEMLGSGDQCEISLIDTTKCRQQFKTTNGQSSNDSELFNNPNFDTDTYQWNLAQIEVCAIKALSTGREKGAHAK